MNDFFYLPNAIGKELLEKIQEATQGIMNGREANQLIQRNGSLYISRWMLARKGVVPVYDNPAMELFSSGTMPSEMENLYLHAYSRSDKDDPHCHPWANATLVVKGWYDEDVYGATVNDFKGRFRRSAGDVVLREATSIHAIVETSDDCVSLFATFQKEKEWGFHTQAGFVHSSQYHKNGVV